MGKYIPKYKGNTDDTGKDKKPFEILPAVIPKQEHPREFVIAEAAANARSFQELRQMLKEKYQIDMTAKQIVEMVNEQTTPDELNKLKNYIRWIEAQRLEDAAAMVMTHIRQGNLKAVMALAKLNERKCAMFGIDQEESEKTPGVAIGIKIDFGFSPANFPKPIEGECVVISQTDKKNG